MKLAALQLKGEAGEEGEILPLVDEEREVASAYFGHLKGDCFYHCLKPRASRRRGKPVLQTVIDELNSEKKFRVLSTDRTIVRMSTFLETTLTGKSDEEVEAYVKALDGKTNMPVNGTRVFVNDQIKNEFVSANMEAYEVGNMIKTLITIIAGMIGFPPSWLGVGDGSNRAIAETQQEPAERNTKNERDSLMGLFEKVIYYVIDQGIVSKYLTTEADHQVIVIDDEKKPVKKRLRDTVTVKVHPVPFAKKKDEQPLSATQAALDALIKINALARQNGGRPVLTQEQRAALLNAGFGADGLGIEVFGDSFEEEVSGREGEGDELLDEILSGDGTA